MPFGERLIKRIMMVEPLRRQSIISLFNILGLTLLGYIATMYFAHVLGPAVLGSYYLFLAYYGIFSLLGDGGFGGAAVKRISEGIEAEAFFSAYILLRIILLVVSVLALLILAPFLIDFLSSGLFPWLILALIVGTIGGLAATGVYGSGRVGVAQASDFLNNSIKILVQIGATYFGFAAAGLAGGFIAGVFAGCLVNFYYLPLKLKKFGMKHLKSLFSFSFWIFLTSSGLTIFATADTILIGYFLTNTDVGVYRVAYQLTGAAIFIASALNVVLFPRFSRWGVDQHYPMIGTALGRAFTFSLFLAIPVVSGGIILGDKLLYYLYGADFQTGTSALILLLFMQVATIFTTLHLMSLNALDMPKKSFIATASATCLNIILNLAFIPVIGITGAALATLVSVSLNALLSYRYLSQQVTIHFETGSLRNILIASVIMCSAVIIFRLLSGIGTVYHLLAALILGASVYFVVLFRIDRGIRNELRDLVKTLGGF